MHCHPLIFDDKYDEFYFTLARLPVSVRSWCRGPRHLCPGHRFSGRFDLCRCQLPLRLRSGQKPKAGCKPPSENFFSTLRSFTIFPTDNGTIDPAGKTAFRAGPVPGVTDSDAPGSESDSDAVTVTRAELTLPALRWPGNRDLNIKKLEENSA